jgi:hypothetical protein
VFHGIAGDYEHDPGTTSVTLLYYQVGVALRLGLDQVDQLGLGGGIWDAHPNGDVTTHRWFVPSFYYLHAL